VAQRDDRIHRSKIAQMKASVDNKPPPSYPHLQQNKKKQQLEEGELGAAGAGSPRSPRPPSAAALGFQWHARVLTRHMREMGA
jgi:hypothetical protein